MRFKFDPKKSDKLRKNPKRAIGFEEVQEIWSHPYYLDTRSDKPEQFRAIGWVKGRLYSVIFEGERQGGRILPAGYSMEGNKGRAGTV